MRHRLPHFSHIFDAGYSASYYAYTWAGDGRRRFRRVQESRQRVRMPSADALLRNRGLK